MKKLKKQIIKKATALLLVTSMGVLALGITATSNNSNLDNSVQLLSITQESQETY